LGKKYDENRAKVGYLDSLALAGGPGMCQARTVGLLISRLDPFAAAETVEPAHTKS